jgi:hypothetical protein
MMFAIRRKKRSAFWLVSVLMWYKIGLMASSISSFVISSFRVSPFSPLKRLYTLGGQFATSGREIHAVVLFAFQGL